MSARSPKPTAGYRYHLGNCACDPLDVSHTIAGIHRFNAYRSGP